MTRRRSILMLAAATSLPAWAEPGPRLRNFEFGIVQPVSEGVFEFVELTRRLPLKTRASGFRWGLGFENPDCVPIEWYELIHLPRPTSTVSGNFQRARNRILRGSTHRSDRPSVIDDFWFDEGDPLGAHRLELFVNDKLRYQVDFEVVAAK
jgi:hypothetical protein